MEPEEIVKKHATKSKIPGISAGLTSEGGIKTFNYGEIKKDSGIAPTPETLYEIGSMTKTFTAILAVKLQEEELLSLDDPVTKFLPEFEGSDFDKNKIASLSSYHAYIWSCGGSKTQLSQASNPVHIPYNKGKTFSS